MEKISKEEKEKHKGIFIFVEIKDHEVIEPGVLELVGKARELAAELQEPLIGVLFAQNAEKYVEAALYYPFDEIIVHDHYDFRHYEEEIFVPLFKALILERKPSILFISATEAGRDLAPRLAESLSTGLTADCTALELIDHEDFGKNILEMTLPAFGGNLMANIICPFTMPQMATVRPGTWMKTEPKSIKQDVKITRIPYSPSSPSPIEILCFPTRIDKKELSLENADIVVAGGRGVGSKDEFLKIHDLAKLLNAQVGATRAAIFEGFIGEEHLIGQTGKIVRPRVYIAIGISGQIQHITGINEAETIIAINRDKNAPIHKLADYSIVADLHQFLPVLIKQIQENKIPLKRAESKENCEK